MENYQNGDEKRLNDILEMIGRMAALDFGSSLTPSETGDMIDAISVGLNMLSEELNARVVEKSKLDEINKKLESFAHSTAHDLRSPLSSLAGLLNLMEIAVSTGDSEELLNYLKSSKNTLEKARNLVHGILEYSKVDSQSVAREWVDLRQLVDDIIETDQLGSKASITFATALPTVLFNRSSLAQIFRNLLGNAVKYCDHPKCEIRISAEKTTNGYTISVADNGPGIAKENLECIFDLYVTGSSTPHRDSHGIGLALVKRILVSTGERVYVESEIGKGATFFFTIGNQ